MYGLIRQSAVNLCVPLLEFPAESRWQTDRLRAWLAKLRLMFGLYHMVLDVEIWCLEQDE